MKFFTLALVLFAFVAIAFAPVPSGYTVCPGGKYACPTGNSCARTSAGAVICCPHQGSALVCPGDKKCCPGTATKCLSAPFCAIDSAGSIPAQASTTGPVLVQSLLLYKAYGILFVVQLQLCMLRKVSQSCYLVRSVVVQNLPFTQNGSSYSQGAPCSLKRVIIFYSSLCRYTQLQSQ
eukprot:TRINITY_DN6318_c0_g3_i1.p1 TRINITY_DN6318_c0_g3~~TRINITY_DN6318_c0_g3_i1.p1  ORF type:complete len:178 (-),score=3.64 TRINITY_DN6318_c0_g3_i1:66-599(-)